MERLYKYFGGDSIPGKLMLTEIDPFRINNSYNSTTGDSPLTAGTVCFFLVLDGWMELTVDKKTLLCTNEKNNLTHILPFNVFYKARVSDEFSGFFFCISKKFIDENIAGKRPFIPESIQDFQLNPTMSVDLPTIYCFATLLRSIKEKFSDTENRFRDELIGLKSIEFILEFASIVAKDQKSYEVANKSRSEFLIRQLFTLLLEHCRENHEVSFYAEKLCITPQYLNKLTKMHLGRSASRIIADSLVTHAVLLLQNSELNIQQVAEELHFSDQSSFGKFFKKQTGHSPLMYKKNLL